MASVTIKDVGKVYRGGVEAVKHMSIDIKDGEFMCLLGPSGCGKSTTMRMVAGLEEITSGEMYIGDKLVNNLSPGERDIAMAFENYALYPNMTIYGNIAFPLKIRKLPKEEIDKKVREVAKLLDIEKMLDQSVKGLSGGVQQRVGVARALVCDPKVLILDEPISHLEEELKAKMREELQRIQRMLAVTTLYVTHDQIEAMVMSDRIAIMNHGELQQVDTPENVYRNPANVFVGGFIGEPPMTFLPCAFDKAAHTLSFDGITIPFQGKAADAIAALGKDKLILGVRHSHVAVSKAPQDGYVEGKVFFIEPRNEEMLLNIVLGEQHMLVTAKMDKELHIGDKVYLAFNYDKCNYFDSETENNLLGA